MMKKAAVALNRWLSRVRRHRILRHVGLGLAITATILAATVVSTLTIDLGPRLRELAEREGSRRIDRQITIGRLGIHVARGRVVVEDLVIAGRRPEDRPFFVARHLSLSLDWSTAMRRVPEFTVTSVELTDWEMLVEEGPGGHSFPNFRGQPSQGPRGPRRFTTTLKYLRAWEGQFAYENHNSPWGIVAPNIDLYITNEPTYRGGAEFSGGTISIQDFVPMWINATMSFTIKDGNLVLDQAEIETDGAQTTAHGLIDLARWPEQTHTVDSHVNFQRMRELFFAREPWQLSGEGDFAGTFHLFRGGHDLTGDFDSEAAGVDAYRFQSLHGSLQWNRQFFEVTNAGAALYGGDARFGFSIRPQAPGQPSIAKFSTTFTNVDAAELSDVHELPGLRVAASASGNHAVEWPIGRFGANRGEGQLTLTMPPGAQPMSDSLDRARAEDPGHSLHEWGPFAPPPMASHLPVGGDIAYRFDPERLDIAPSRLATESTAVRFEGTTAWGQDTGIRFHVTSRDWQESDQVLAGMLTNVGSPTRAITFGGRGEFDGLITGALGRPRVEGRFAGEDLRAWDTMWGDGEAQLVIENQYVEIKEGVVRKDGSEIRVTGRFSMGYPRRDGGEEIDASFRVTGRDLQGVRHAFGLDDYPVSGLLTGNFNLAGEYERPIGFGAMTILEGHAYGEPFERGDASLRFDGLGVRLDDIDVSRGTGGMTGAAFVGWDGTYAFDVTGGGVAVESLSSIGSPALQPTGMIEFTATGSGTFEVPRYDVRFTVQDLFVEDEGVGQVSGTLALRGDELTGELSAASPRLAMTGAGRISLTSRLEADMTFRFHDTSLDPYVRLFVPDLSPFTTAVASGTVRVNGQLSSFDRLIVDATIDTLDLRLFDYAIRNDAEIRLALDSEVVRVDRLALVGDDTRLTIGGTIALDEERIALEASGDANLGILQGFFRDVRGSGQAELLAAVNGPLYEPLFSGTAVITDGRLRHFSLPNSLEGINGTVQFDSRGVRLDDLTAVVGGGRVQFGGRVELDGYMPAELNVTARGEGMQLRYPEGVRSTIDADLTVRGSAVAPTLGGTVTVRNAIWSRRIDPTGGLFDFGGDGGSGAPAESSFPLTFDMTVVIPSTLRIENNMARLVASADLQLRGTYDRPLLFGRAEVDRGDVLFEGRRYLVTRGAIDFNNPTRIEPFFDVEAETRVRVPGETYRVIVSAAGTMERLQPQLSSDPPLPAADVVALLFSDVRRDRDVPELRALQNPNELQTDILATRATQLLASPISSEVGRVVEQTFGVDTFQLTPSLIDPYTYSATPRVDPSARVTIGKRISERVYLTFSRSLSTSQNDQILLLEYDESERLSWVLSRNEDQTYAVEVRVRHAF